MSSLDPRLTEVKSLLKARAARGEYMPHEHLQYLMYHVSAADLSVVADLVNFEFEDAACSCGTCAHRNQLGKRDLIDFPQNLDALFAEEVAERGAVVSDDILDELVA